MLIGEYNSPLGEKNRVAMPRLLRKELADELVVARGYERSLIIIDQQRWQNLMQDINKKSLLNMSVRDTKRFLLGGAYNITLDKQGRFVIPEALIAYSQIEKQISFVGVGDWVEIWSQENWEEKLEYLSQNSADIADRI